MLLNPKAWIHGLISAFITGSTSAISASMIKPEAFNFGAGFHDMLKLAAVAGIMGAAAYLKSSPLPAIKADIESQKGAQ
jgi:hypothetical protein